MAKRKVQIQLDLENKRYLNNIRKSESALDKFAKGGRKLRSLSVGFLAVTAAVTGIAIGIKKLIGLSEKQVRAETRLNQVLKSTKNAAGLSAEEIKKMAASLQQVTTYGDEAIIEGQNLLLTFTKIGKDVFPQATETMLDMSETLGTDLKTSALQLGKALNDPIQGITSLRRYGVQLSESQEDQIKQFVKLGDTSSAQKIILEELATQMGGQARAATETLTGKFEQLKNAIGDNGEEIGGSFTPGLFELTDALGDAFSATGFLTKAFSLVGKGVSYFATNLANLIRYLNIYTQTSTVDKLREDANQLIQEIKSYRAKGLEDDNHLIQHKKQKLEEINQQMELITENSKEQQQKIAESFNQTEKALGSLIDKQNQFAKSDAGSFDKTAESMVSYYERLGQYQNAAVQQEYESFQAFQNTQNYKRMTLEEQAVAEQQYRDARLVAEYQGAQREAQIKEQVLRAKMGMESQAFKGAKMFAQAGAQLMSSQSKELFKLGQVAAIANIVISASEAVMKGWAQMGPFGGSAFAALMGVVSSAQIANVLKQKPPKAMKNESADAPKPVVSAPAFAQGVYDIKYDTPAFLHRGETVMPKSFSDSVKEGDLAMGGTTIIVQGSVIDTAGLIKILDDHNKDIQRRTGTQVYSRKMI